MNNAAKIIQSRNNYFSDTSFKLLMQKRIIHVLLICSDYDFFILEEDGRINEQVFNEYASLNIRYPPLFIHASSEEEAFTIMHKEGIDLIITMLSVGDPFALAKRIKSKYPKKPIVVLTPFSREVSQKLAKEDMSAIDHVFCWLGNADILLAIIKLIEDKMNEDFDIQKIGVQAILLVEDSIRFYSSYLPILYKHILQQSREFMTEGLNEHQKMLRMRGRPKILLATTYEEAVECYEKYKHNLLGIISDISFSREGKRDTLAGKRLCEKVHNEDANLTFLLQSSDSNGSDIAKELNVFYINKHSKTLSIELSNFINEYLAFGDFVFRDPVTHAELDRAPDLQALQHKIFEINDDCLNYHIQRDHFSKWLNARALFPIAEMFKYVKPADFNSLYEVRQFLYENIVNFRMNKGRGVIGQFRKENFDEYLLFSRIGQGSLGGKARGLAFIDSLIKRNHLYDKYDDIVVSIPKTVVLTTDIFDEFMEKNCLYQIALSDIDETELLNRFISATLPEKVLQDLATLITVIKRPLAIRSSSLLEDSYYQPFAGIYSTYMIPKHSDDTKMLEQLHSAIKSVYASVFYRASKAYMTATANVIDEEKMAIVLQEVCGEAYGNRYYPAISGVARSYNFYPIDPEKSEEGVVNIAFGLGKYIADGGTTLRFSPKYPKKILQLSSPELALRETQKIFYALNLDENSFVPSIDESKNLLKLNIRDVGEDTSLKFVASTYDFQDNIIRDGVDHEGKKLITFSKILNYNIFPLADILQSLLAIGQKEMNTPVEIEFAVDLDKPSGNLKVFNLLQIRPIVDNKEDVDIKFEDVSTQEAIIVSDNALGNGIIDDVYDFVYVKPTSFDSSKTSEIALMIESINNKFLYEKKNYVLIGPGRWGSSDPWLGIPVKWPHISAARVIVESGLLNYRIDPSQGTHFFQNLTSFRVGYFTINPYLKDGFYDLDFLNIQTPYFENEFIRHIRFENPIVIKIDGKRGKGLILKPKKIDEQIDIS